MTRTEPGLQDTQTTGDNGCTGPGNMEDPLSLRPFQERSWILGKTLKDSRRMTHR